ncbi:MAG: helix-turn-helix transcriptional regulator [Agathobacter sp.]|nr:helix-turn-helix transcriptional regulator [Agathobacter sp.]MBQ2283581.1 helix-turn-helix transcriptional regulator [Agathobacter sp.]
MKEELELIGNPYNRITKFSERLVLAMNFRDVSNKELADAVFVAPSTISSYRTGHRIPNIEQLALISTTLEVSCDYLLGLTDSFFINHTSSFILQERLK